jgi:hypothetical protein
MIFSSSYRNKAQDDTNCRKNTQEGGRQRLMEFGVVSLAVPVIQMNFGNNPFRTP